MENVRPPAFLYMRVSKEDTEQGKKGIDDQRQLLTEKFGSQYDFVQEFVDEGVSRRTYFDERPAGRRLLSAILDSDVKTVLVANHDRLGLYKQAATFLGQCDRNNVKVLTPDGTDQTTDYVQAAVGGIVSEKGYTDLVQRMQAGRRRRKAQGFKIGGTYSYGYHPEVKYAHEKDVLRMMIKMHEEGKSYYRIMKFLNDSGIKTRDGKRWYLTGVIRTIKRGLPIEDKATAK